MAKFTEFDIEELQLQKLYVKLLLNMTISNFAQYDFEFALEKSTFVLTKSEFRRRFPKYSWSHALVLPGSFQKMSKQSI